ncbi:helix-turn-helix domain-containing protein [Bacillus paramycoides]
MEVNEMMINKAYKFCIYPNQAQAISKLEQISE